MRSSRRGVALMSLARRVVPCLAVAVVLVAPASGRAKEIGAIGVCGADACTSAEGRGMDEGILQAGGAGRPPSRGAPFYRVMLQMRVPDGAAREGPRWEVLYVPSLRLLRSQDGSGDP